MYKLDYHGDDYGISLNNCKRFVELMKADKIDSISIISNMGCYDEAMDYLLGEWNGIENKPLVSVHINLMDGYSLTKSENSRLTAVVNSEVVMSASWGKLFLYSCIPGKKRNELKKDMVNEIAAQIDRVIRSMPEGTDIRLDSHQHTHMIPLVFDAMLEACDKLGVANKVSFVRVSREPLFIFLTTAGVAGTFPFVNVIKNIVLNILSFRAERILRKRGIAYGGLWGLIMTGKMDRDRVDRILPRMEEYACSKDKYMEILCHPGIVLENESRPEYGADDLEAFFSENRDVEYNMLCSR